MSAIPIKLNPKFYEYSRCFLSEFIATFIFLFAIFTVGINVARAGALIIGVAVGGLVTAFAAVAVLVSFGDISGAHFNPAITFGALLGGKIAPFKALLYVIAQLSASTTAAALIYAIFPYSPTLISGIVLRKGATVNYFNACAAEFIFTMTLLLVVYMVGLGMVEIPYLLKVKIPVQTKNEEFGEAEEEMYSPKVSSHVSIRKNYYAAAVIGLTLGFLSMLGGNISGGAFNPAVVFGPQLISGVWGPVWIYWVGDLLGAAIGTLFYFVFFSDWLFYPVIENSQS